MRRAFLLATLAILASAPLSPAAEPTRPNVLLIVADDMGFSDAGCYGGEIDTPNLDALAKDGLRFTQFYNTARCWPSRAAILTGYYAQQVRRDTVPGIKSGSQGTRPPWARLLPEMLHPLGYRSYHSGKWHVDGKPLQNGFDHSYSLNDHDRHFTPRRHTEDDRPLPAVQARDGYYSSTAIADHAIKFLKQHAEKYPKQPFFQFLAFTAPHFPVQAPAEDVVRYRKKYLRGWEELRAERWKRLKELKIGGDALSAVERDLGPPYAFPDALKKLGPNELNRPLPWKDLTVAQREFQANKMAVHAAMVDRMDSEIGRVLDQLRAMKALENTLVFFLSDNGASAEIMVRGDGHDPDAECGTGATFLCIGPGWSSMCNTPFRRHKTWVHEGGISTTLIVHWPKGIAARGELRRTPGHVIDLMPTILEVVGGKRPDRWDGQPVPPAPGKSLAPLFARDGTIAHDSLWWLHEGNRALRIGNWKIVAAGKDSPWELYDLSSDRSESKDLAKDRPEKVRELAEIWNKQFKEACALAARDLPASKPRTQANPTVLDAKLHHLRAGAEREWSDSPSKAEGPGLALTFPSERNDVEWTLRLRQRDVKQTWNVLLNGKQLARLLPDENDTVVYLPVPAGRLLAGENKLVVQQVGQAADDVWVGEIILDRRPVRTALSEATVEITVREAGRRDRPVPVPCRITVVNGQGTLMTMGAVTGDRLAVRPGVLYTADGRARFGLPAGEYTVYAGRGFAYGIDSVKLSLHAGDTVRKTLTLRREVPLDGWAACDTHVHTLTYSGHGDCTAEERVLTLAGEGLELPIITDHNKQIDLADLAVKLGVRDYFTPVAGNEVTTSVGHFNIFPVRAGGPLPDHLQKDWAGVFKSIADRTRAKVVILNHPRDLHASFRPFGPEHHLALTGDNLDGWELRANAMEVVNSGAQQTDVMRPIHDWFGLLNRGLSITPVGASDSHDVSRFIVGQGRTYIRCKSDKPGAIDVAEATRSFVAGRVLVSCGLVADITVNDKYGPGDLAPATGEIKVTVRVLGPAWTTADRVELYANGRKVREERIRAGDRSGVKWSGEWTLPRFKQDVHLVAVASGPGVTASYWPIAKPYQPTSPVVLRRVLGVTGAVWLDADGDGRRTSARGYAERLLAEADGEWSKLIPALADYDEAVCVQAASLLRSKGVSFHDDRLREAARASGAHVARAFETYAEAWRASQIAREAAKRP